MAHRIEISSRIPDARAGVKKKEMLTFGITEKILDVQVVEVYTIDYDFSPEQLRFIAQMLANPITQRFIIDAPTEMKADWAIEIGFLPGVTDNIANTVQEGIVDLFRLSLEKGTVFSSQLFLVTGTLTEPQTIQIANQLANGLINRISIKSRERYLKEKGMSYIVPRVKLLDLPAVETVNLEVSDEELSKIGKQGIMNADGSRRGPLALDLESMKVIREYFLKEERRMPFDIELESIAQTWSEHCKHTIFANELDELKEGIFKTYIRNATNKIRAMKGDRDFCVSVFEDNSGGIIFDEHYLVTDKVETHNSPSALDPFGGSITGIVGVNRDAIGFGQGALPIMNRYGFCFGYPEDKSILYRGKNKTNPALSPLRIMEGVIDGVKVGGNCSGIPTPQGFVYFDDSYKGKPLVFVGTAGLIPRTIAGTQGHLKKAQAGDYIVVVGGRVGKDGIHGATFSSEALDSGSPATAVQIGDPITQKKMSDALVKEARDAVLYNSITDNGAGGLSCSVAEMARECGGFVVDLEKVPVKYAGIQLWEMWVSESQERMTLSVPKEKSDEFLKLMEKRGVEATIIGEFNESRRAVVNYDNKKILDLDMMFLHDGVPKKKLKSITTKAWNDEPAFSCPPNLTSSLLGMLRQHNLASFSFISRQYDHEVQGGSILKPVQGKGEVNAYTTAIRPLLDSKKAVIASQGINARYSLINPYHMAACAIDTAIKNVIAAGGDLQKLALLDNFCWCSSDEPGRLGELKAAAKACYDYALAYKTPFISGKDSMFNDFKGFDELGNAVKISVLPTLLISSLGVIEDYRKTVSLDAKYAGDTLYLLGETKNELGASEYFDFAGKENTGKPYIGNKVPKVNAGKAVELYSEFSKAVDKGIIASSIPVNSGGLGIALAKMCIAGELGALVDLAKMKRSGDADRDDALLFSESQSRILVSVAPESEKEFESIFAHAGFSKIGKVISGDFIIQGLSGAKIVQTDVGELEKHYKRRFRSFA